MATHLSSEQIENYGGRRLSPAELVRVNEHLFGCEACYQQYLEVFQLGRRFPIEIDLDELAGLRGWHLQGEELKAYVEGRMDELNQGYVNLHLQYCGWCREEVSHFSEFAEKLEYYLSKRHAPLKQQSDYRRYFPKISAIPFTWSPARVASAAALIVVLVSAAFVWSKLGIKSQEQEATVYQSSKEGSLAQGNVASSIEAATNSIQPLQSPQSNTSTKIGHMADSKGKTRRTSPQAPVIQASADRTNNGIAQRDAEASLIAENLVMPAVIEMFDRAPVVLRGDGNKSESFRITSPYSTVISDDQPTFRWTPLTGASSYTVSVYDANLNLIEMSEPLTTTQWSFPSRLKRGVIYTWLVTALKDGKEVLAPTLPARAEFKIIELSGWAKLRTLIKNTKSGAARGALYAKVGLLDEAEQELRAHLDYHPADKQAIRLLETIRSWREP